MMRYLLDTDTCIDLIRHQPKALMHHLDELSPGEAGVSAITAAELMYDAERSARPDQNKKGLARLFAALDVLSFDHGAAQVYAGIRRDLEQRGQSIGPLDTLIAAHALFAGLILITRNLREFKRVPGLRVESWS